MKSNGKVLFPISRIALALGIRRQAVAKRLAGISPDGFNNETGRAVQAWAFESLPADWRHRLQESAKQRGFRSELHLLTSPPGQWSPKIPLGDQAPRQLEKAAKLLRALAPVLKRLDDAELSPESEALMGLEEYQRQFGHKISLRHWRRLLDRTLERDGGAERWDRLELYLDDRQQKAALGDAPEDRGDILAALSERIAIIKNPAEPTASEVAILWHEAFLILEARTAAGIPEVRVKRGLIRFLASHAPHLSASAEALRWTLNAKLRRWRQEGRTMAALLDKRPEQSGWHRRHTLSEAERLRLLARIAECGGRISQGYREMLEAGEFDVATMLHFANAPRRKSYVPRAIREAVRTDAKLVDNWMHGPHRAKMAGAYILRKHDHAAGDWLSADDLTCPIYTWDESAPRNPLRPQVLVLIDTRSMFIMGFVLIMSRAYNGTDVRRLITLGHDAYGLPRKGFYFERSIWKSNLVTEIGWESVDFTETESGFGRLGLAFRHAREARAKIVERVLGLLQNQMERDMAYAGRDERHDRYERVQKHLQQVHSGRVHPAEFFMHRDELTNRMEAICELVNNERQEGKILEGRSPADGFREYFTDPLIRLEPEQRYLLASYRRRLTIGRNGITLRFHGETFNYKSDLTGRLQGQEVQVFFNPEDPDLLSVSDLQGEIPFTVERCLEISAMNASEEDLATAMRQVDAHNQHAKRIFRAVRQEFPEDFTAHMHRRVAMSAQAEELGVNMAAQRATVNATREAHGEKRQTAARTANKLGLPAKAVSHPDALAELNAFLAMTPTPEAGTEEARRG